MITENLSTLKIHKLTQAQYERELAAGRIDENALYLTPDEEQNITVADVEGLQNILDNKASKDVATTSTNGLLSSTDKSKLDGVASGAEVNQNAFSNVKIGDVTIAADTKTDTLTLVADSNVTITPDANNDKITIAATDTNYYHTPIYASGIEIATGTGVADMYVPIGTSSSTVAVGNHTHTTDILNGGTETWVFNCGTSTTII